METVEKVGSIKFGTRILSVYDSLDDPLFMANEISDILGYSGGNAWNLLRNCEADEKLQLSTVVAGQRRMVNFVNENGLYNILAQSYMPIARKWRRIVHNELIEMRKKNGRNISEQFEEWDHRLDGIYFDEESGRLMQSVTVPGGDVIQSPYGEGGIF